MPSIPIFFPFEICDGRVLFTNDCISGIESSITHTNFEFTPSELRKIVLV